jgi:hypothetical protein
LAASSAAVLVYGFSAFTTRPAILNPPTHATASESRSSPAGPFNGLPFARSFFASGIQAGMVLALFEYLNAQLLDRQGLLFDDVTR